MYLIKTLRSDITEAWSRDFDYANYVMLCKCRGITPVEHVHYVRACEALLAEMTKELASL